MRTSNPVLNDKSFGDYQSAFPAPAHANAMTLDGTVTKTGVLLALLVAAAGFTWNMVHVPADGSGLGSGFGQVAPWAIGGAIGGFIVAMIIIFKKTMAPMLAPVYAILEGLFLGAISAAFEAQYPGIVPQAVGLTFGTLFALLLAYRSGLIRATESFKLGVVAATGGIFLVYMATFVLGFFGVAIPFIHGNGLIGIGFSAFVVVIAAMNLVLDFDFIESGVERGAPKYMEWYAGFGLLVTLVWLYIAILRLLSKLQSRN